MTLIREQLETHFGDDYEEVYDEAKKFVNGLDRSYHARPGALLNEGDTWSGVVDQAMCSIIEHEMDISKGLKAFGRRMGQYAERNNEASDLYDMGEATNLTLGEWIDNTQPEQAVLSALPFGSAEVAEDRTAYTAVVMRFLRSEEELELYTAIANTRTVKEAAALIGMDYADARKINLRVWSRVYRAGYTRGYNSPAGNFNPDA